RPADALHRAALELSFDVARMNGAPRVLRDGVAQDRHAPRLRIHLNVDEMRAEARARALRVDAAVAADRSAGLAGDLREIRERHRLHFLRELAERTHVAIRELDLIGL